jgi:hypothetical protein
MIRYFRKELPRSPLYLPNGARIEFDPISDGYGYYHTSHGYEIAELLKAISSGRGGVSEISKAEWDEYLKKKGETPQSQPLWQRPSIGPSSRASQFAQTKDAVVPASSSVVGVMADGRAIESFAQPQRTEGLKVEKKFAKPVAKKVNVE